MTKDNSFTAFLPSADLVKFFEGFQKLPFDLNSVLETQQRNIRTISEAQQLTFRNFNAIFSRQAELFTQMLKDQTVMTQEMMKDGKPEDKITRNAELFKKGCEKTLANIGEIGEMVRKTNVEATSVLNKRLSASMKELKSAIDKSSEEDADKIAA